jgi:trehalose 6-phosphate phosphatase
MIPQPFTDAHGLAMFLDFDGTLVDIAERPDAVHLAAATRETLMRLQVLLDGALAIVSGRDIHVLDAMLSPFRCPVAGVHGLTRRDAEGRMHGQMAAPEIFDLAERRLCDLALRYPALLVERKSYAIAIHYRGDPARENACLAAMEALATLDDRVKLVRGKMVVEMRLTGGNKGTAIAAFMMETPFAGRQPFFAGDDVTDEDAFRLINARGGATLKIGSGATEARYRLDDSAQFLAWLAETADTLKRD